MMWARMLLCAMAGLSVSVAQSVTVHVVDAKTLKPLRGVTLNLRDRCFDRDRPAAHQQSTDVQGVTIFPNVSLSGGPLCMDVFSIEYAYAPGSIDYIFATPEQEAARRGGNPFVTRLPAEITFSLRKRSFAERLRYLFQGD